MRQQASNFVPRSAQRSAQPFVSLHILKNERDDAAP